MKTKIILCVKILILFLNTIVWGQNSQNIQNSCLFEEARDAYYKQNPNALSNKLKFDKKIEEYTKNKSNYKLAKAGNFIVPVVFHIYGTNWESTTENQRDVTDEVVRRSLADVNANYRGFNDPVDSKFASLEAGMNIEFRLAQIDPNGNTTTGIVYHEYKEGFGLNGESDGEISKYAWDNNKYCNIHIQLILKADSTTNSGIAWFPDVDMNSRGTARIVYNGKYLIYSPPASSLTHEFGHYLGLEHTFYGKCNPDPKQGDLIEDTPATDGLTTSCDPNFKNCFGQFINFQNHMDYNPCESMFTKGQVARMEATMSHPARINLWRDSNLVATGIKNNLGARVLFNYQERQDSEIDKFLTFIEDFSNSGKIINKRKLKAVDGARFAKTGFLTQNVDFRTENVPSGLTPRIRVIDATKAEFFLEGSAVSHLESNSGTINLILLNPSIIGGVGTLFKSSGTFKFQFTNDFVTSYYNFGPNLMMGYGETDTPSPVTTTISSPLFGGKLIVGLDNFDGNKITIDNSATKYEVLCNPGTTNARFFSENSIISPTSAGEWKLNGCKFECPKPVISSPEYTDFRGRTGYIAIRIATLNSNYAYGWVKASVSSNGEVVRLLSTGVNTQFGQQITANINGTHATYSDGRFLEALSNNQTFDTEITMTLRGTTFSRTGSLTRNTHFTVSNLPSGLDFSVNVTNSTTATLRVTGTSTSNTGWDPVNNLEFKLLNSAVSSGNANAVLFSTMKFGLEYIGKTLSGTNDNPYNTSSGDFGGWIPVMSGSLALDQRTSGYAFQDFIGTQHARQGVKLITYRKDAVSNSNFEIIPLDQGTLIGPGSQWQRGRNYNIGSGQHQVDASDYTVWRGKTKYVGIRIRRSGRLHYGWLKLTVSSDGKNFSFTEYALAGIPDAGIYAGTTNTTVADPIIIITPPPSSEYCSGTAEPRYFTISNVKLANLDSNSEGFPSQGYSNFTNRVANLTKGKTETISITTTYNNPTVPNHYSVWIDWNQNKSFDDPGEKVLNQRTYIANGSIAVPTSAKDGNTRMRVRYSFDKEFTACGYDDYFGEVEDYTVNVSGGSSTTTLPIPKDIRADVGIRGFYAVWTVPTGVNSVEVQLFKSGNWVTVGTSNNHYFYVEKESNILNYRFRIRSVNGTNVSPWSNAFDATLTSAARLSGVEDNGLFDMKPNPASDIIYFTVPENNPDATIEIYDYTGKMLDRLKNTTSYEVNKLNKGIYYVKYFTENFSINKILIKN